MDPVTRPAACRRIGEQRGIDPETLRGWVNQVEIDAVLTTFDIDDDVFSALRAGASGFLLKDAAPDDLVAAVRTMRAGEAGLVRPGEPTP